MCAVDGRGGFQDLRQLCGQSCVAEFSLPAGEFIAILEIAKLIFQLDEFGGKEQVLGGVIRNVVGDGIVPLVLLRRRESGFCIRPGVQRWSRGLAAFVRGFVIERVMEIDPEPAVKLEDGKRPVGEIVLCLGSRGNGGEQRKCEQEKKESRWWSARHSESHDSSAKSFGAQTSPKQ